MVKYFIEVLNIYDLTAENEEILKSLCDLYAVHGIVEYAAEFMNVSVYFFSLNHLQELKHDPFCGIAS